MYYNFNGSNTTEHLTQTLPHAVVWLTFNEGRGRNPMLRGGVIIVKKVLVSNFPLQVVGIWYC